MTSNTKTLALILENSKSRPFLDIHMHKTFYKGGEVSFCTTKRFSCTDKHMSLLRNNIQSENASVLRVATQERTSCDLALPPARVTRKPSSTCSSAIAHERSRVIESPGHIYWRLVKYAGFLDWHLVSKISRPLKWGLFQNFL